MIQHIKPKGSKPTGPYTPLVTVENPGRWGFVSGQGPTDPDTGEKYLGDDVAKQAKLTLGNVLEVLKAGGFSATDVVQVTVYLRRIGDLAVINTAYQEFFPGPDWPARETVEASNLPSGQLIEVSAIAAQ